MYVLLISSPPSPMHWHYRTNDSSAVAKTGLLLVTSNNKPYPIHFPRLPLSVYPFKLLPSLRDRITVREFTPHCRHCPRIEFLIFPRKIKGNRHQQQQQQQQKTPSAGLNENVMSKRNHINAASHHYQRIPHPFRSFP